jgi:hypothetical protein
MKLWWCVVVCLFLGRMSWADDQTPSDGVKPSPEVVPIADPIGVHPLFGAAVPVGDYEPLTGQQRLQLYLRQTFTTPNPWLRTSISTGIAQIQGRQHSWGGGVWGYGRRYSSQYATYVIRNSFLSLGAWGLGHDTRYVPAKSPHAFARIGHAVMQNFLTVNREGTTTVNFSRILSGYGAGMIATNWQPNSKWSAQGVRAGNEQLIYGGVFNIGREFAPEVDHLMRRLFHSSRQ